MITINNIGKTTAYLPNKSGVRYAFTPGINEIEENILDEIKTIQGEKWDIHYSKYMIEDEPESVQPESNDNTGDEEENDPGAGDGDSSGVNDSGNEELKVAELKEVIDGMDKAELDILVESENNREEGSRKTVVAMIEKAMKKFNTDE